MHIVIVGGGKVGYYLAKTLMERNRITLIEKDPELCRRISDDLGIVVLAGDAVKPGVLADAAAESADVVVAATGKDEDNLIVCQVVQEYFAVPRVIARVNNPRNEPVFRALGVSLTVSSTAVIAQLIEQEVATQDLRTLLTFNRGNLAIVETRLGKESPVVGSRVADIADLLPQNCVLVTIIRKGSVILPRGETQLEAGDEVLAVTTLEQQETLEKVLTGH